jgi:putative DNA methylase
MGTPRYGLTRHCDLFTPRQLTALATLSELVSSARERVIADSGDPEYGDAIATYLGLAVGRFSDISNALCRWENTKTQVRNLFTRQAIPMVWDFAEPNIFANAAGDFGVSLKNLCKALAALPASGEAHVSQRDATSALDETDGVVLCTDPPYYDNVPYGDLSDFFYVWLRQSLSGIYSDLFSTVLTPKTRELIADSHRTDGGRPAARAFFEEGISRFFDIAHQRASVEYPMTLFYAFKQSESEDGALASTGWETMLSGLLNSGLAVTGTWPMRSELSNRMRSLDSNALASSIVLVCRPRSVDAGLATRRELAAALRAELPAPLRTLQQGSVAPVDLAQAAIGPGMAVFSRYSKVVEADGSPMKVRTALGLINEALDELLAEQEADFDADTRWCVAWFEQHGMNDGPFGQAETLSRAKNTAVNGLVDAGVVHSRAGKVRLLDRSELDTTWDPEKDARLTVWEVTQHLITRHQHRGEQAAAELLRQVGGDLSQTARELAYRLFAICERKSWTQEALAYNELVSAWPEITRLAAQTTAPTTGVQESLEV